MTPDTGIIYSVCLMLFDFNHVILTAILNILPGIRYYEEEDWAERVPEGLLSIKTRNLGRLGRVTSEPTPGQTTPIDQPEQDLFKRSLSDPEINTSKGGYP